MLTKILSVIFLTFSFALGFVLSMLIYKHEQKQTECVKSQINDNLSHIAKTDEKIGKKIVYKTYYRTGELKSEEKSEETKTRFIDLQEKSKTNKSYDVSKKWQAGVLYYPGTSGFDKKNIALQVSYNIVSDVWVSAQTTCDFKTMLGLQLQF